MKSVNKLAELIVKDGKADAQPNKNGNIVHRFFAATDRYLVDFAEDFTAEHWEQYDTDQDAHYFGVWVNPDSLRILSYAEGDWTLVTCLDSEAFNAEIEDMNAFYGEGYICKAYGLGGNMVLIQDRSEFLTKKGS